MNINYIYIVYLLITFNIFSDVFKINACICTIESSFEYKSLSISLSKLDFASCELIPIRSDIFFDLNICFEFLLIL